MPKGFHMGGAATVLKFFCFLADVVDKLISELRGETYHCPGKGFIVRIFGFGSVQAEQLIFDSEIYIVTRLGLRQRQQRFHVFFLFVG